MDNKQQLILEWKNVSYKVKQRKKINALIPKYEDKQILFNVSGSLKQGEMIAILGPSGSGKTSLLSAIAGKLSEGEVTGTVLLNEKKRDHTWKFVSAFVEQNEYMLQHITARESILFSAFLRLSREIPVELKVQRCDHLIRTLGLLSCQNTMIADISGGERKRTAIAIELITSPTVIFLDEPTSGLDSFTALSLIETLKSICESENKAILLTIHQPRPLIMELFSKFVLLSQGRVIFSGTQEQASFHFESEGLPRPPNINLSDFLMDSIILDNRSDERKKSSQTRLLQLQEAWQEKSKEEALTLAIDHETEEIEPRTETATVTGGHIEKLRLAGRIYFHSMSAERELWKDRASVWLQFRLLVLRNLTDLRRYKAAVIALVAQTLILAGFVSIIFWQMDLSQVSIQNRMGVLFFLVAQEMFAFTMPISVVMPAEKSLIIRERANVSYKTISAYLAKIVSVLPQAIFSSTVLGTIVYWCVGLTANIVTFSIFLLFLFLTVLCSQAVGMIIGGAVKTAHVALIAGPMVDLVFVVFAGSFINSSSIPGFISWLQYISPAFYAYRGLMQNEFWDLTFECSGDVGKGVPCFQTGQQVLQYYNLLSVSVPLCFVMLTVLLAAFHIVAYFILLFSTRPKGKIL